MNDNEEHEGSFERGFRNAIIPSLILWALIIFVIWYWVWPYLANLWVWPYLARLVRGY